MRSRMGLRRLSRTLADLSWPGRRWEELPNIPSRSRPIVAPWLPSPSRDCRWLSAGPGGSGRDCWSCGRAVKSGVVCGGCGSIQPVAEGVNHFEYLGLRGVTWGVVGRELSGALHRLQRQVHPDRAMARSPEEQEYAAAQSARVNAAYAALSASLPRAEYILHLHGHPIREEEKILDRPDFLMDIMELNESIQVGRISRSILLPRFGDTIGRFAGCGRFGGGEGDKRGVPEEDRGAEFGDRGSLRGRGLGGDEATHKRTALLRHRR